MTVPARQVQMRVVVVVVAPLHSGSLQWGENGGGRRKGWSQRDEEARKEEVEVTSSLGRPRPPSSLMTNYSLDTCLESDDPLPHTRARHRLTFDPHCTVFKILSVFVYNDVTKKVLWRWDKKYAHKKMFVEYLVHKNVVVFSCGLIKLVRLQNSSEVLEKCTIFQHFLIRSGKGGS